MPAGLQLCAFIGGVVASLAVYGLARYEGRTETVTLILTGVAVTAIVSAAIGLLIARADDAELRDIVFWSMGSLGGATWAVVGATAPCVAIGVAVVCLRARELDLMTLGEREASHLGVDTERSRLILVLAVALATGAAVAVAGVIAFVGLVVPHLVRLAAGPAHAIVLPGSALGGAALVVLADVVARTAAAPVELPLGVITSLAGGPFFLWLLWRTRRAHGGLGMSVVVRGTDLTFEIGGRKLVDGVDLELAAGEVLALTGPNGAGKSTLLRLLSGELEPTRGSVELDGRPLGKLGHDECARLRAVMPQETVLQFAFTVREVVAMGRHPHRRSGGERDGEAVESAMRWTEILDLERRTYPTLSGGERGRTTLARVLAQESPILLLDEPTAALDIRHQERAMTVARSFADTGGAVIAVLHDLNLAAAYADRIALLDEGRWPGLGPPWAVLREDLLGSVFDHPVVVTRSPCGDSPLVVPARA